MKILRVSRQGRRLECVSLIDTTEIGNNWRMTVPVSQFRKYHDRDDVALSTLPNYTKLLILMNVARVVDDKELC